MQVRLTAKLAEVMDGIDLSQCAEGDIIEVTEREAHLLLAEGWAQRVEVRDEVPYVAAWIPERAVAADTGVPDGSRISAAPTSTGTTDDPRY
jgi:hypothetical protein